MHDAQAWNQFRPSGQTFDLQRQLPPVFSRYGLNRCFALTRGPRRSGAGAKTNDDLAWDYLDSSTGFLVRD
jgi:hypothetical protein